MIAATNIKTNIGTLPPLPPKFYTRCMNLDEIPVRDNLVPINHKFIFLPSKQPLY